MLKVMISKLININRLIIRTMTNMEDGPIVITLSVCPSVCKSTNPMLYDKFNLHRRNHLNFLPIVRIDERRL